MPPLLPMLDAHLLRNVTGIEFIHSHAWFVLPYLVLSFGSLFWLGIRKAPRWSIWVNFLIFSLPCLGYMLVCLKT